MHKPVNPKLFCAALCSLIVLSAFACGASTGMSAPQPAPAGAVAPAPQPCAKHAACENSVCSIEGVPGTATLNALSCPQACCSPGGGCGLALTATTETLAVEMTECIARDQPGAESAACPDYFDSFAVGGENLLPFERENLRDSNFKGCCRPEGACGFAVSAYGLGCVSVRDMPKFTALIPFVSELVARTCTPLAR